MNHPFELLLFSETLIYVYIHIYIYVYTHTPNFRKPLYIYIYTYTKMYSHICLYMYMYTFLVPICQARPSKGRFLASDSLEARLCWASSGEQTRKSKLQHYNRAYSRFIVGNKGVYQIRQRRRKRFLQLHEAGHVRFLGCRQVKELTFSYKSKETLLFTLKP